MNTTLQVPRAPRSIAPSLAIDPTPAPSRRLPLVLMAAGLAVVLVAVALVVTVGMSGHPSGTLPDAPASHPIVSIGSTEDVEVHRMGYGPHESSQWHRHSGLHAIAVLTGTLTVYGPDCQPTRIAAGQSYVGGQGLHLARNETDEPVEMSVTYLFPQGVPPQNFVIPMAAPAGCQLP